ncbi:hypothetical protein ACKI10_17965 [Streptomyces galilaeus]|uniref:Uncharacterized protein n=1 Tax=Streptomyces galilaeus TaxID=33899 RepID=A0ABW9IN71_STRGJ
MTKLRAKRVGAGYYEVATPHGTYRVENIPSPNGSGYGSGPNWVIIEPGQDVADASKPTKREAMEYIQGICDQRRLVRAELDAHDSKEAAEAVRRSVDAQFPAVAAFLAEGHTKDSGPSLDDYAKAGRIIQSLIPGVRR